MHGRTPPGQRACCTATVRRSEHNLRACEESRGSLRVAADAPKSCVLRAVPWAVKHPGPYSPQVSGGRKSVPWFTLLTVNGEPWQPAVAAVPAKEDP